MEKPTSFPSTTKPNPEPLDAAAVAEIVKAIESIRADAHLKELEYNDKEGERQFTLAKEQREAQERWLNKINRRWWAIFGYGILFFSCVLLFAGLLIASDDPNRVSRGWDILKIFGSFIVGVIGGWGIKASKPN